MSSSANSAASCSLCEQTGKLAPYECGHAVCETCFVKKMAHLVYVVPVKDFEKVKDCCGNPIAIFEMDFVPREIKRQYMRLVYYDLVLERRDRMELRRR